MSIFVYGPDYLPYLDENATPRWDENPAPRSGLAMRLARESLGLSADQLSEFIGVSLRTVQYWEAASQIPGHAETALKALETETAKWQEELAGARNIIVHKDGHRRIANRWIDESWWRAVAGKAVSLTGATVAQSYDGYAISEVWEDDEYYRFEIGCPNEDEEEYRTGKYGEGLYRYQESGTISLPDREPIMEWKQVLGTSQFHLKGDFYRNRSAIHRLIRDMVVRDHARNLEIDRGVAAGQIGGRYIGQ
jgi:transcriptional regulator with XRE-family HTH domain